MLDQWTVRLFLSILHRVRLFNVKLTSSKEEKSAKLAAEEDRRNQVRAEWEALLHEAVRAADDGDVVAEETFIIKAVGVAQASESPSSIPWMKWQPEQELAAKFGDLCDRGLLRKGPYLGFVGQVFLFEDRILVGDEAESGASLDSDFIPLVRLFDGDTHAEVMTEGEIRESKRPTLTRMAFGSVLPGTALIPGLAFQKTQTTDNRRLYFTIEQSDWGKIIELDPSQVNVADMRQLAMNINVASRRIRASGPGNETPDPEISLDSKSLTMEHLKKLDELRDAGVITEDEFAEKKRKLLDEI